jgi:hypothetical protein
MDDNAKKAVIVVVVAGAIFAAMAYDFDLAALWIGRAMAAYVIYWGFIDGLIRQDIEFDNRSGRRLWPRRLTGAAAVVQGTVLIAAGVTLMWYTFH